MSVYEVKRAVDTVTVSMDIATAEALTEILGNVLDHTGMQHAHELFIALEGSGEIRWPSKVNKVAFSDSALHLMEAIGPECRWSPCSNRIHRRNDVD